MWTHFFLEFLFLLLFLLGINGIDRALEKRGHRTIGDPVFGE
jgi:hypothetical protein